jgi:hypothetical protein
MSREKSSWDGVVGIKLAFYHLDVASGQLDPDPAHNEMLIFKDWDGFVWEGRVQYFIPPGHAQQPVFKLTKL